MQKRFEELDYQETVLGELVLRRRKLPMLDDEVVYEVLLNEEFLMSSLFHAAEDALAEMGIGACEKRPLDVVVGGLGLGYTAAAALARDPVRSLLVVEFLGPVIGWHRGGLLPLQRTLADDPRLRFVEADFFACATSRAGFDPDCPGRKFDVVLLDIDHTPKHWLNPGNAAFYSQSGLQALAGHLQPQGMFAMWSDGAEDADFLSLLGKVFDQPEAREVRFPNPIQGGESASTVYLARRRA